MTGVVFVPAGRLVASSAVVCGCLSLSLFFFFLGFLVPGCLLAFAQIDLHCRVVVKLASGVVQIRCLRSSWAC